MYMPRRSHTATARGMAVFTLGLLYALINILKVMNHKLINSKQYKAKMKV